MTEKKDHSKSLENDNVSEIKNEKVEEEDELKEDEEEEEEGPFMKKEPFI